MSTVNPPDQTSAEGTPADQRVDALTEIRGLVARCTSPLLDRRIIHDDDGAVARLIRAVTESAQWPLWIDVPLSAVVGMQRVITTKEATWRQALSGLEAQDWDARVYAYWSSEIRDQLFPATQAYRALRLSCHAGAVVVENGAHRMTAGMAWLCATRGDSAVLQRARVRFHEQRGHLVDELIQLARSSRQVDVATRSMRLADGHDLVDVCFVRAVSRRGPTEIFTVNVDAGRLDRDLVLHREAVAIMPIQWELLPSALVEAWANRGWLAASLARAERCPTLVD